VRPIKAFRRHRWTLWACGQSATKQILHALQEQTVIFWGKTTVERKGIREAAAFRDKWSSA